MIATKERQLNIKELTVPEPENGFVLSFDPELEFTPDVWNNATEHFVNYSFSTTYIESLGRALYLAPNIIDKTKLPLEGQLYKSDMGDKIESYINGPRSNNRDTLKYLFFAQKLYPPDDPVFSDMDKVLDKTKEYRRQGVNMPMFYEALLFPQMQKTIPESEKMRLTVHMQTARELEMYSSLAMDAAEAKILTPRLLKANPIIESEWMSMKDRLHQLSDASEWVEFVDMAFNMYLLSGDILYKNGQIEITPPNKKWKTDGEKERIPERRRF